MTSRFILLAAMGLALLWSDCARSQDDQPTSAANDEQLGQEQSSVDEAPQNPAPPEPATYIYNAPNSAPNSANQDQFAEANLRTQRDMSRWTLTAALAAGIGAAVSIVAVVLVYLTLKEAQSTTRAAVVSTKLTKSVLDQERAANQRQLRAYITVDAVDTEVNSDTGKRMMKLVLKNTGQTPAFEVQASYKTASGPMPFSSIADSRAPDPDQLAGKSVLGPGQTVNCVQPSALDAADLDSKLTAGDYALWLFGTCRYLDCFEKPRFLKFRYRITKDSHNFVMVAGPDEGGNEAN